MLKGNIGYTYLISEFGKYKMVHYPTVLRYYFEQRIQNNDKDLN